MWDNIKLAINGLKASKMRTFLTMLGIIIGIASVIAILTIADAMKAQMEASYASMGMDNITLNLVKDVSDAPKENWSVQPASDAEKNFDIPLEDALTVQLLNGLRDHLGADINGLAYNLPKLDGTVSYQHSTTTISVMGASDGYLNVSGLSAVELTSGRWLNDADNEAFKKVAVIRESMAVDLFGSKQASLGQQIDIAIKKPVATLTVTVVGTYTGKATVSGGMMGIGPIDFSSFGSPILYLPIQTAQLLNKKEVVNEVSIGGATGVDLTALTQKAQAYADANYQAKGYHIEVEPPDGASGGMDDTMKNLQMAFAAVAAISLLVGGIGVMNIMMVSITERTREIGVRKALGARRSAIRLQFITESVVICILGGVLGVLIGIGLGYWVSMKMGYAMIASLSSIGISVGFSLLIGIFFGYYPANKAAKMQPLDALRYE